MDEHTTTDEQTTDTETEREQAEREMARQLFGVPAAAEPPARPAAGTNYVPREGTGQVPARPPEYDARDAVGELFGMPESTRNLVADEPADPPYIRNQIMYPPAP